ncbi:hypothetical protein Leryth_016287 [Lithospermum erythrorhizon]|uniref:Methyltransferase n=1 Tax=Lithospermum erythrorhizon TaxID=34254 RepID=A0AAV3PE37_LITER|nr:hypothetical protein Leryth_016287 [Lithospermum erythrorhizon]
MEKTEVKNQETSSTKPNKQEDDEDIVCLDGSFFVNDDYKLTTFTFGSQVLELYCLQSASTDFDLTGQLVWPGAILLNNYLSKNANILQGCSVLELGSGVGVTGILCSRFCKKIVMTDHNDEVIKIMQMNIDHHQDSEECGELQVAKLEWGDFEQMDSILLKNPEGFDLILGADICFQQKSVPLLFDTVKYIFSLNTQRECKFILGYVSRTKVMDAMVVTEAIRHGFQINEVDGARAIVHNLEGVVYEITLSSTS